MLRALTRVVMPMVAQTAKSQQQRQMRRSIYSESYLNIDAIRGAKTRSKLAIAEPGKFIREKRTQYEDSGISDISDEDLLREAVNRCREVSRYRLSCLQCQCLQ